jgi:hypothetical protein
VLRADESEAGRWRDALASLRHAGADVYLVPPTAAPRGVLATQRHQPGGLAYVCRGTSCLAPVAEPGLLLESAPAPQRA